MFGMERSEFLQKTNVSHETAVKLDRYAELLIEWNQKFNLVAKSTIPHIWTRHFLDSAQLANFIPKKSTTLIDLGSGAGFPGLVLSIMDVLPNIHLVESTGKKAIFLQTIIDELGLKTNVHHCRIEEIKGINTDIITARAVASLSELFKLSMPLIKRETLCLFMKGQNTDSELTESKKYWKFDCEKAASISDDSGSVLIINNLKRKK